MSVFKSAMGYFSSGGTNGSSDNDFVGQVVEIGNIKLRVKKVIAEGGFAFVFIAQDTSSGTEYALKRLMAADQEANKNIIQEISLLKKLSGHPNIIKYMAASFIDNTKTSHGMAEYLLLTDLCSGGSLMEALQNRGSAFPVPTILRVFYQACRSVQHMHAQVPPIAHRDLKLENFLITNDGMIKLCDFGSATTEVFSPDTSWNVNQRTMLEENLAMFTTPMYRAPEMLDTWNNHQIDQSVDVWALGCILYTLCYMQHPFEDSAKLAILNGNYTLNQNDQQFKCFHEIIRGCLVVNPEQRLSVNGILERLAAIAESTNVNLKQPLKFERKKVEQSVATSSPGNPARDNFKGNGSNPPSKAPSRPSEPQRPPPPAVTVAATPNKVSETLPPSVPNTHQPAGGLFSSLKGGAGSFLKNLKDTSSKVMQTVQQTIARSDLDISYITSRIAVMPFPSEGIESAYKTNHIDDVRAFLDSRHPSGRCLILNASGKQAAAMFPPPTRTLDVFAPSPCRSPPLRPLYTLLRNIYRHLERDEKNVCVITCQDGKSLSAILVCAVFLYCRLVTVPEDALQMFAVRRCPPNMQPSQLRYLYYLTNIIRPEPLLPHYKPMTVMSITIQPVPLFTKVRDGCRPYVEVYNNDRCILSTLLDYERLHVFNVTEGKCMLQLNVVVSGDVTVAVYHARHQLGRPTGIKMFQLQFNTGYVPQDQLVLRFNKSELDDIGEGNDHFPSGVSASVGLVAAGTGNRSPLDPEPWTQDDTFLVRSSQVVFSTPLERDETVDNFVSVVRSRPRPARPAPPSPQPPRRPPPPDRLARRLDNSHIRDGNSDNIVKQNDDSDNAVPGDGAAENNADATDTFDLFANFPPPPSKITPNPPPSTVSDRPADGNLLFPEDDSFGDFLSGVSREGDTTQALPGFSDLLAGGTGTSDVKSDFAFDPFGLAATSKMDESVSLLTPNVMAGNGKSATSNGKQDASTKRDPFADFGNFGSAGGQMGGQSPMASAWQSGENSAAASRLSSPSHRAAATPSPSHQADYNRAHFETPKPAGEKVKKPGDVFGDLLGSQGYEFARKDFGPRTINQMRKEEVVRDMDPEKLLIVEWTEGKKSNIRALLCSLHTVVWETCRWSRCDMGALVGPGDVRKAYRRACLAIHPDKQMGTENENIAKLIFMELNNAWSDFEGDEKQQNLFQS